MKLFQANLKQMTRDYAKMEEYNMQQWNIITALEQTFQDLIEQQITTHIKFEREKQNLSAQIQDWKC